MLFVAEEHTVEKRWYGIRTFSKFSSLIRYQVAQKILINCLKCRHLSCL